jgi:RNA polymerase sigma-70 factor, ECF subfamily
MGSIDLAHAPSTDQAMDQVRPQLRSRGQAAHTCYNERTGVTERTNLMFGFMALGVRFGMGSLSAVSDCLNAGAWTVAVPYDTGRRTGQARRRPPAMAELPLERTVDLIARAKVGDTEALDRLCTRFLPSLRRWASGRLPRHARSLMDTDDLVQETVIRAVKRLDAFEPRHEGALQAYLRQAVMNRIRDEVRRAVRSPAETGLDDRHADGTASPLDVAIGAEAVSRYEAALARLRPEEREAVIARIEMDGSYHDLATALGKPSADAARMAVSRALVRLAEEMSRGTV